MISELKTAFQIGYLLYLPMLAIDMIVASILLNNDASTCNDIFTF